MMEFAYDRNAAVQYARQWAHGRNPDYYDFEDLGGDCTNFASQCVLSGAHVMNHTPDFGWYYYDLNNRAPAWTSVLSLYQFITQNKGPGPFGAEASLEEAREGDLVQLKLDEPVFQHTPVIVSIQKSGASHANPLDGILVAAHSIDSSDRPLSTYDIHGLRFIHIEGGRK
ncbi:MAG: amidase domain-containing protein [Clostridiales bacterium]|jgi:hypothetical protein|nr:amidase domain-containing protein [Clostridiales bacterium]